MGPGDGGDKLTGSHGADDIAGTLIIMMYVLIQSLQIIPRSVLAQAEDLAGSGDVSAAGRGGVGPHEHVLIVGIQQIIPGFRHLDTLGSQFLLKALLVDDDAQNAHVPALPEMIGIVKAGIQAVIVGRVICLKSTCIGQRAIQVHRAAYQNVRLRIAHLCLHTGHGIAAAQRDVLDLNAGILLELVCDGDGIVLVQCGIDHQLAAGLSCGAAVIRVCGRGIRFAAACGQSQRHSQRQC